MLSKALLCFGKRMLQKMKFALAKAFWVCYNFLVSSFDRCGRRYLPRGIVQLVERRSPKPNVEGSSPFAPVWACSSGG